MLQPDLDRRLGLEFPRQSVRQFHELLPGFAYARPEHEGWPGLLHGGVTFSLMDEALGWVVYFQGRYGVTAKIDTRFRRPIPIGTKLMIKAWTIDRRRRFATARAEVRAEAENQPLMAEADATIYLQESEKTRND